MSTPVENAGSAAIDTYEILICMNDTSIPQNVSELCIRKVKSGFVVEEKSPEGYVPTTHACTDDIQVNLIVNQWTNQQQYN